jgi:hypothetical protein
LLLGAGCAHGRRLLLLQLLLLGRRCHGLPSSCCWRPSRALVCTYACHIVLLLVGRLLLVLLLLLGVCGLCRARPSGRQLVPTCAVLEHLLPLLRRPGPDVLKQGHQFWVLIVQARKRLLRARQQQLVVGDDEVLDLRSEPCQYRRHMRHGVAAWLLLLLLLSLLLVSVRWEWLTRSGLAEDPTGGCSSSCCPCCCRCSSCCTVWRVSCRVGWGGTGAAGSVVGTPCLQQQHDMGAGFF